MTGTSPRHHHEPPDAQRPGAARLAVLVAGWGLILAPLLAVAVKGISLGLSLLIFAFYPLVPLLGYALLVLVATSMIRRRGALRASARPGRLLTWAWLTSGGVLLFAAAFVDGGYFVRTDDDPTHTYRSVLTMLAGAGPFEEQNETPLAQFSNGIAVAAAIAWVLGYLALVVELIIGWRRARRATDAPRQQPR